MHQARLHTTPNEVHSTDAIPLRDGGWACVVSRRESRLDLSEWPIRKNEDTVSPVLSLGAAGAAHAFPRQVFMNGAVPAPNANGLTH
jgi:hypothetical protein